MIKVNRQEIRRYLGYQGINEIDANTEECIEECLANLEKQVNPKYIYKYFPIKWNSNSLEFAGIKVIEGKLSNNLSGCNELAMMAVTLGPAPDMLVRRASLKETFKAMVYEDYKEFIDDDMYYIDKTMLIRDVVEKGGEVTLFTRPRFSPGYGDFPLDVQKDFDRALEMPKTIGVSLADSLLMTPTKSITAVIGLSTEGKDCVTSGCDLCNMKDSCEYSLSR